ncbi:MAG: hypothetical protein K2K16_04905 [Ruminococcus sp.]|nr:hypothetical protein [Ruminococcus sp.]
MEQIMIVEMPYNDFYEEYPFLAEVISFENQVDMEMLMTENPLLRAVIREKTGTMLFHQLRSGQEWQIPLPTDTDCEEKMHRLFTYGIERAD